MSSWKTMFAVVVAAAMVTAPVWAQTSTTPSDSSKGSSGATSGTSGSSGTMSKDTGTSGSSSTMSKDSTGSTGEMKSSHRGGKSRMGMRGGNREQVKAAQQALKDKGHDPGAIDGRMGPKTQAALKEFQKAEGLKETGRLDSETMTKLGVEGKTGAAGTSSPAASPATDKSMSGASSPSSSGTSSSGSSSSGSSMPSNTGTSSGSSTSTGGAAGSTSTGGSSSSTAPATGGSTK